VYAAELVLEWAALAASQLTASPPAAHPSAQPQQSRQLSFDANISYDRRMAASHPTAADWGFVRGAQCTRYRV